MSRNRSRTCTVAAIVLGVLILGGVGGCGGHYAVKDPASGTTYYTKSIDKKKSGVVTLKDARTGSKVTLQSSEVHKISKEEFEAGVAGRTAPPAKPAPAPPPAGGG